MFYIKQCKCGSLDFETEIDDEQTTRCANCGRLATILWESTGNEYTKSEV